jgi:N-acyl-D-aspartate/D-glutamate deacylase
MKFTPRMDGTTRATINVSFHITPEDLVTAAMHVVSFEDKAPEQLTKRAIDDELRKGLWADGSQFAEFGREKVLWEAHDQLDAIKTRVAELYNITF